MQPLKHVADVRFSSVDKKSVDGQLPVRLCNYTDVYYNDRIVADMPFMEATATPDQISRFSLRAGDVLLTKDSETAGDIGVSALVAQDLPGVLCGYHLAIARPHTGDIDGRFLRWALEASSSRGQLEVAATGVTRFGLRQDAVAGMLLPTPDLAAQRAIADYLDAETARIDRSVGALGAANQLVDEWLASMIETVVWGSASRTSPLMHLTRDDRQIQYGIVLPGPDVDDGVPIVKGGDLIDGALVPCGLSRTTREIESGFARSRLQALDIVFAIRGAVGACALVPPEVAGANITQDVAMVAPRRGVDPLWLLFVLQSRSVQAEAEARTIGATIRGLNIRDFKRLTVPLVDLDTQRQQAAQLQDHQRRRDQLTTARARQIKLLRERRQAMITAAVTGQLEISGVAA